MTADDPARDPALDKGRSGLLKYQRVVALVRDRIADGTLRPGQPAPSGAELSRVTRYSVLTCRKALRVLIANGVLVPGPSRNARPRVAGVLQPQSERDLADATRALSGGLAAWRHAAGLTQPELALLARVSVTTIGHAETGRVWQSRRFWERADAALAADGDLLRLHDTYRAASASQRQDLVPSTGTRSPANQGMVPIVNGSGGPSYVMIVWADGAVTTVHPPDA
jgi:hypothetical protein